jgi:tRNA G18 (ribose-2'-O)-methylase SpoU
MPTMPDIILIAHNIRSTHNVGSLFRTAEGFGVSKILLTGYTPYPTQQNDNRLPHITEKITKQIHKTALDAETMVPFEYREQLDLATLQRDGYGIVALEQASNSVPLPKYKASGKIALLLGEEVEGITKDLLEQCDTILEIPMFGQKESFNVSVAAGIALYQLTCLS